MHKNNECKHVVSIVAIGWIPYKNILSPLPSKYEQYIKERGHLIKNIKYAFKLLFKTGNQKPDKTKLKDYESCKKYLSSYKEYRAALGMYNMKVTFQDKKIKEIIPPDIIFDVGYTNTPIKTLIPFIRYLNRIEFFGRLLRGEIEEEKGSIKKAIMPKEDGVYFNQLIKFRIGKKANYFSETLTGHPVPWQFMEQGHIIKTDGTHETHVSGSAVPSQSHYIIHPQKGINVLFEHDMEEISLEAIHETMNAISRENSSSVYYTKRFPKEEWCENNGVNGL